MKSLASTLAVLALCCSPCPGLELPGVEFFVATDGNDDASGKKAEPLASLEQARRVVAELRQKNGLSEGGVTVWLRGGTYRLEETFELTRGDSGSETAPIAYRAWPAEEVRLSGGRRVTGFGPVTDPAVRRRLDPAVRDAVVCVDLGALGIDAPGELPARFRSGGGASELFFDDRPMQLARWPDADFVTIERVIDRGLPEGDLPEGGRPARGGTFVYGEDRPRRWRVADGVWLHGYWCHDWFDECIRVASIDVEKQQITLAAPHGYGIGPSASWNRHPRRYYALNVLEELDRPGEWYLDRRSNMLFFLPPKGAGALDQHRVVISILQQPLVSMKDTSNVTFAGLTFETSRGTGVVVSGGSGNLVTDCRFRNLAGSAVRISGGTKNGVTDCEMLQLGQGGIHLSGGDRAKLTPGEHYAVNNHIHHFARLQKTYAAGIHIGGVGQHVAHNLIHHAPHSAILYGGNEHVIELNEIHNVALETSDVGAFYTGRDWTSRGNILRHNFIHDLGQMGSVGTMGIYLDDCDSGDRLVGNVFLRAGRAAFIGGGRDNVVENNIFIECDAAVHIDARGLSRLKLDSPGGRDSWDLLAKAQRLDYRHPPWSTRYPKLATIMEEQHELPLGNVVRRNVAVDCKKWINVHDKAEQTVDLMLFENNLVLDGEHPGFVDAAGKDFRLKEGSVIHERIPGFKRIPFEQIGLRRE